MNFPIPNTCLLNERAAVYVIDVSCMLLRVLQNAVEKQFDVSNQQFSRDFRVVMVLKYPKI
jgi:hypothetical protein